MFGHQPEARVTQRRDSYRGQSGWENAIAIPPESTRWVLLKK